MSKTLKDHLEAMGGTIKVALGLEKVELPSDDAGRQTMMQKLGAVFGVNARGNDDDPQQIMADLLSSDRSPFLPADSDSLRMMSGDTLKQLRDDYLKKEVKKVKAEGKGPPKANAAADFPPEEDEDKEKEEPVVNEGDEDEEDEDAMKIEKAVEAAVAKALAAQAKSTEAAIAAAVKTATDQMLTAEQRGALALATNVAKERRNETIARVVALSTMTKEAAEKLDTPTLELFASSLHPTPNYGARIVTQVAAGASEDAAIKAMTDQEELRDKLFKGKAGKGSETAH